MATNHIEAKNDEINKIVLMAGDPLRVKYYADKFLKNKKLVSKARGILAYSGKVNELEITLIGHGMGLDSIGIYAFELFKFYNVDLIMRLGSCGSYNKNINLYDLIVAKSAYSFSNYGKTYKYSNKTVDASESLLKAAWKALENSNIKKNIYETTVNSSMWFYDENPEYTPKQYVDKGIDVVEMESYALYIIAKYLKKQALTILTVSDNIATGKKLSIEEREKTFDDMFLFSIKLLEIYKNNGKRQ
ncbi:MAG: purine nucleoside phosphorylase DeoD-type [Candidatus Hepatoplasma vulgare]|nr:MAG: purine nucleoside phosphorylase DeoD-type [Candidatus Hepatoplasma sp.]